MARTVCWLVLLFTVVGSPAFAGGFVTPPDAEGVLLMVGSWPVCAILAWCFSHALGRRVAEMLSTRTLNYDRPLWGRRPTRRHPRWLREHISFIRANPVN